MKYNVLQEIKFSNIVENSKRDKWKKNSLSSKIKSTNYEERV